MTPLDSRPSGRRPDLLAVANQRRLMRAGFHPTPIVRRPPAVPERDVR